MNNQEIKQRIFTYINKNKIFNTLCIQYILYKSTNIKDKFLISVYDTTDQKEKLMYIEGNKDSELNKIREEKYSETSELYFLKMVRDNYKILYIAIAHHINMWEYLHHRNKDIEVLHDQVLEYFRFCRMTGINVLTIRTYGREDMPNLYVRYMENNDSDQVFIHTHIIEPYSLELTYNGRLDSDIVFTVRATVIEENKCIFIDHFKHFEDARLQYLNMFYRLNYLVYDKLIDDMQAMLDDFEDILNKVEEEL